MLHSLLDVAMPTPIDLITFLFVEQPLIGFFVLIPILFSLVVAIVFIVLVARKEREEDKKHEEEYRKRMGE